MRINNLNFLSYQYILLLEFTFLERGFELTMLMIIGTDGIDNHAITTSKTSLHEGEPLHFINAYY
jgi:hypothetical protein